MAAHSGVLARYKLVRTESENIPYELHGPRGARYGLMRCRPHGVPKSKCHTLFAVNLRTFGCVDRLGWFTDKDGTLKETRR